MLQQLVIIGAGEIGKALEKVLRKQNLAISLWDKDPSKVRSQKPLKEIVPDADFLFLCIPSWALRNALNNLLPFLNKKTLIISLAKGIEENTKKTTDELLQELLPRGQNFALLFGPMLAEELTKGMVGIGVVASKNQKAFHQLAKIFTHTNLYLEYSKDIRGVALSGVLKNIYAIALGIADGLRWGGNAKGWLVARAINEMAKIAQMLGGKKETALGTAGLGDLIATGFSPYSRNRRIGYELVRNGRSHLQSEGFISLSPLGKRLYKNKEKFLLLKALEDIIIRNKKCKIIFENLRVHG